MKSGRVTGAKISRKVKPKDVWSLINEEQRKREESTETRQLERREPTIVLLGSLSSGKSTLLQKYLFREKSADIPRPTVTVDYRYTRSSSGLNNEKELAHFWEIGGGRPMSELTEIALTPENIENSLVLLTTDLSKQCCITDDLLFWLEFTTKRVAHCISKVTPTNGKSVESIIRNRSAKRFPKDHPDRSMINPSLIPLVIVATKYDEFKNRDSFAPLFLGTPPESRPRNCRKLITTVELQ
eukprot:139366_1